MSRDFVANHDSDDSWQKNKMSETTNWFIVPCMVVSQLQWSP